MKKPSTLVRPGFFTSIIVSVLASEVVWGRIDFQRDLEAWGSRLSGTGALYCELPDAGEMPPGDGPTGERRPKESTVTRPAGCIDIDMFEIYELDREVEPEDMVAPCGREVYRPCRGP